MSLRGSVLKGLYAGLIEPLELMSSMLALHKATDRQAFYLPGGTSPVSRKSFPYIPVHFHCGVFPSVASRLETFLLQSPAS